MTPSTGNDTMQLAPDGSLHLEQNLANIKRVVGREVAGQIIMLGGVGQVTCLGQGDRTEDAYIWGKMQKGSSVYSLDSTLAKER